MFKVGDTIRVKNGVVDPDFPEQKIGGWQGRILSHEGVDDETGEQLYLLAWDSISLRNLLPQVIVESFEAGFEYYLITLADTDLESATPRDTQKEVDAAINELEERYYWLGFGEQGARIQAILEGSKSKTALDLLKVWEAHLKKHLKFPLAVQFFGESEGQLQEGMKFSLQSIAKIDPALGLLGSAKLEKGMIEVPLCDVEAENMSERNQALHDYAVWYANL